jgi:hypothetical protein
MQALQIPGNQAFVTLEYACNLDAMEHGASDHCTDGGIHSRGVSSTCENADSFDSTHQIRVREVSVRRHTWKLVYF